MRDRVRAGETAMMSRALLTPRDLAILAAAHRGGLIQRAAPLRLEALDGERFPIFRPLQLREAGYLRGPRPGERGQRITPRGLYALSQAIAATPTECAPAPAPATANKQRAAASGSAHPAPACSATHPAGRIWPC